MPSAPRLLAAVAALACAAMAGTSDVHALKLATWNLEHLADNNDEGCRPRTDNDYRVLKQYVDRLDADVVAVQEVENAQALARVFDPEQWSIEIARNPDEAIVRPCGGLAGKNIITQRTGFAIRKPIRYTRNPDLSALDIGGTHRHRYGVDVTIEAGTPLRLLAVHLKSGCNSGPPGSGDEDCQILFEQQKVLKEWVHERAKDEIPFAILGDFNRRLQNDGQFWTALDTPDDPLRDLSLTVGRDIVSRCHRAFREFIDFIVLNRQAAALFQPTSFHELIYDGAEADFPSDHCPITIELGLSDLKESPPQKGHMTTALKWFQRSAEFPLIARFIYDQAARRVDAIKAERRDNWIVSLDADETILDNSLAQLENESLGLGYVAERWKRWEARGAAKEIPGAIDFMNHTLAGGGKLAIVTNRGSEYNEITRGNLIRLGLQDDRRKVCVIGRRPADTRDGNPAEWERYGYKNDKDRRRRLIAEGNAADCWANDPDGSVKGSWNRPHQVVLWIGDNILDLPGTTQDGARKQGTPGLSFGKDYFLLPNPLYGSWEDNKP
jgi:predicted secreted acid phosphatase/endonuclease/exonuclease/phosphatase family metal-dependent hydrolase